MKTIYKYRLDQARENIVSMPENSTILHAGVQDSAFFIWALVNLENKGCERVITIMGTGWGFVGDPGKYIGTVHDSGFVWHVFDGGERA